MKIKIGKKFIGENERTYIIAEAGVNHNGSLERAKELIRKAAAAGVDAIKFQTYKAEKLVTKTAPRFWEWEGEEKPDGSQFDSYDRREHRLEPEEYPEVIKTCEENNIEFLSTAFDHDSADFLDKLGMKAYKTSSSDLTNLPLLKHIAKKQKPMLLSTGSATMEDIEDAIKVIKDEGNDQIILLHCTLCYPTKPEDANLRLIPTLEKKFPYPIGISDHTLGTVVPIGAVAIGAKVVEKHYTVDKTLLKSSDHWLAVDPLELNQIVNNTRTIEKALGSAEKKILEAEQRTYKLARRSIVANCDIPKGSVITESMLIMKRPGSGIRPKLMDQVIGKTTTKDISEDTILAWEDLS